ncbi:MAG: hypothetical protein ABI036_00365 [Fibrobacteria bacterium]
MFRKRKIWMSIGLALPLAFSGCMKPSQDGGITAPTDNPSSHEGLDASHGGARVMLPEIDPATLNKQGVDTIIIDTMPQGWFELTISGPNMSDIFLQYPLGKKGGYAFEVKAIPAGKNRSFHGRLLNRQMQPTHEGVTVADIRAGEFTDIHLYLSKASGTANVCVVIEGMTPPACANDTIPPPPPDTTLISHCWYVGSDSVTGQLTLYDTLVSGYTGVLVTNAGTRLPVTSWASFRDTLSIIVIRTGMDKKWRLSGTIQGGLWTGSGVGLPMESPFSFYGKPLACQDTLIDTLPPPKDTSKAGRIPRPISSVGETTLCFEMQLDYDTKCKIEGYAKMSFFAGSITHGNITIAEGKGGTYTQTLGS